MINKIYNIGRFYEKQDQTDSAIRRYEELVKRFPDHELAKDASKRKDRLSKSYEK